MTLFAGPAQNHALSGIKRPNPEIWGPDHGTQNDHLGMPQIQIFGLPTFAKQKVVPGCEHEYKGLENLNGVKNHPRWSH